VITPLGPDTLGVALTLGIATESEHGVDAGWDCCSSSKAATRRGLIETPAPAHEQKSAESRRGSLLVGQAGA
jgi:hypothetical protein